MVQQNIHGGDIYRNQVSLDFSVNINPFGMPQRVREALEAAVAWCERYPDIRSEALRDAIAGAKGDCACGYCVRKRCVRTVSCHFKSGYHAKKVAASCTVIYGYDVCGKVCGSSMNLTATNCIETDGLRGDGALSYCHREGVNAVFWQSRIIRWVRWWSRNCWRRLQSAVRSTV